MLDRSPILTIAIFLVPAIIIGILAIRQRRKRKKSIEGFKQGWKDKETGKEETERERFIREYEEEMKRRGQL